MIHPACASPRASRAVARPGSRASTASASTRPAPLGPTPAPTGRFCRGGDCVDPCDGAVCPAGQRCVGGSCVDPCAGVTCPTNQVCIARDPAATTLCGPSCDCSDVSVTLCPSDKACDTRGGSSTFGLCVDPGCETATCAAAQVCSGGMCVDACDAVTCPLGQICQMGACVEDPCARVSCPSGQVCRDGSCVDPCEGMTCPQYHVCRGGMCVVDRCAGVDCNPGEQCVEGRCTATGDGGGLAMDGGAGTGGAVPEKGGCGCLVAGARSGRRGAALGLLGLLLLGLVVRRRRT